MDSSIVQIILICIQVSKACRQIFQTCSTDTSIHWRDLHKLFAYNTLFCHSDNLSRYRGHPNGVPLTDLCDIQLTGTPLNTALTSIVTGL